MIILLLALAATPYATLDRNVVLQVQVIENVQAKGRVISGHEASARHWKPESQANQREVVKIEKGGRTVLLRLTEFE